MDVSQFKTCVLCGESTARPVFADERLEVIQCSGCGLLYQADYAGALARLNDKYRSVEDYYERRREDPVNAIAYKPEKLARSRDILDALAATVPPGGHVLDVGSGMGEFIFELRRRGLQVAGVEPDEYCATFAREQLDLPVIAQSYHAELFPAESFDAISFIQVLEHVEDPIATLSVAHYHLRPDGVIVVDVPSYNNPRILAFRLTRLSDLVKSDFIPPHNYYYTRDTLSQIAIRAGFRPFRVLTGRYAVKYGGGNALLRATLPLIDRAANRLGVGGITLYAQKA
jgi:2-polyprenyl-3-methyl-5-hydroxy-6-metoxy-1,4-benzoquinol methylase